MHLHLYITASGENSLRAYIYESRKRERHYDRFRAYIWLVRNNDLNLSFSQYFKNYNVKLIKCNSIFQGKNDFFLIKEQLFRNRATYIIQVILDFFVSLKIVLRN